MVAGRTGQKPTAPAQLPIDSRRNLFSTSFSSKGPETFFHPAERAEMLGLFKRETRQQESANPIDRVAAYLHAMGYVLTPYGAGVALLGIRSGYTEVEAASHIALTTMARDVKEAGSNIVKLVAFVPHAHALLRLLKEYADSGLMHPTQWQNDSMAIYRIVTVDEHQLDAIEQVLSDPIAGKERLAKFRIEYCN
jgi:hypothetical protein